MTLVLFLYFAFFKFCTTNIYYSFNQKKSLHECHKLYLNRIPDSIDLFLIEVKLTYHVLSVSGIQHCCMSLSAP